MQWHALAVTLPRSEVERVSQQLLALGATGIQEDVPSGTVRRYKQPWDKGRSPRPPAVVLLRAWFTDRPAEDDIRRATGRAVEWSLTGDEDWAETWKTHFHPVKISDRLTVAAPWHGVEGALVIEPGNAFGTGDHVTTRACLHAIDRLATPGRSLLDVGCGSGILALAGARLGMVARGVDIDPVAIDAAQAAAALNGLPASFDATPLHDIDGDWDLVVANLYAEVIAEMGPDLRRLAVGHLVFAGLLADRADLVRTSMTGLRVVEEAETEGWVSLVYACGD